MYILLRHRVNSSMTFTSVIDISPIRLLSDFISVCNPYVDTIRAYINSISGLMKADLMAKCRYVFSKHFNILLLLLHLRKLYLRLILEFN